MLLALGVVYWNERTKTHRSRTEGQHPAGTKSELGEGGYVENIEFGFVLP